MRSLWRILALQWLGGDGSEALTADSAILEGLPYGGNVRSRDDRADRVHLESSGDAVLRHQDGVSPWRVISVPAVSCAIDIAPPAQRTATKRRRVASPSAAKIGAELRNACRLSGTFRAGSLGRRGFAMFCICSSQPPLFMRNASSRRAGGTWSKPDSTTVRSVPPSTSVSSKTTRVVGSCECNHFIASQNFSSHGRSSTSQVHALRGCWST